MLLGVENSFGQQKRNEIQTKSSLALKYYNAKDFEKATPLLKEVHKLTRNSTYFRFYLNSLIQQRRYDEAESELEKEIKKVSM